MKYLSLFLFLILFNSNCYATCIVIIFNNDTCYVAADSRSTVLTTDQNGKIDTIYNSICKIHDFGSVFLAMAGYGDGIIPQIVQNSIKMGNSLAMSYELAVQAVKKWYQTHFEKMRKENFNLFKIYKERIAAGGFSFFGFSNKSPFINTALFYITSNLNEPVKIDITESGNSIAVLGISDHIFNPLSGLKPNKHGMIYTAEDTVKYEMSFHRKIIAAPIDLLEIVANNKKIWIRKKQICN